MGLAQGYRGTVSLVGTTQHQLSLRAVQRSASSLLEQPVPPYENSFGRTVCPESIGGGIPSGPRPGRGVCVGPYSHSGQFYEKDEQNMNSVECPVSLDTNDYVCNLSD